MKNLKFICLISALLGLIVNSPVMARGGGGSQAGGGGHGGISSGGRHFGGGQRHFRGGHSGFSGGHRHSFRGGRRHNNRFIFGLGLGGLYSPGYYGYGYGFRPYYRSPYYGYPSYYRRSVVTSAPIVYIQREEATLPQTNYWHYCRDPEGYYPYVKQCQEGWLRVAPQPPAQ